MPVQDTPAKPKSNLYQRVISAAVLAPVVLGLIYWGGLAYAALVLAAAVLFLWEWFSITGTRHLSPSAIAGQAALICGGILQVAGNPQLGLAVILAGAGAAYVLSGFSRAGRWGAEGVLYSGFALFSLLALRSGTGGLIFIYFLFIVVWATDIFAYFTGRALGGPKLWARVSPKKTWSGALGGLVFAIIFGAGVSFAGSGGQMVIWAGLAAVLSIVSQAGDLLESAIKRRFDVKDSSQLIPGHGGIMDRIDGLVAAAIFAVLIGWVAGGTLADPLAGLALN
ncbi:phosphatidate cytidylyltransferase [Labrenzia sp. PHM005]|uniref:phosphatidate cytidylyltransferase n=1 Tax=Labrenzia sp. PHM005 TaxID=2590016 RepID=UPI00114043A8|nr:phosphatidate cytidylyltransferase [Labrenzia sp. PHM005]QDG79652.1 phosphatidate cytidylyltransferase [Labrenzia sp. PHM005]